MTVLPKCIICVPHAYLVPQRLDKGIRFPGTGVMDGCGLPCGYRKINPGLLQGQHVLLSAESYLWLCNFLLRIKSNINSLYKLVISNLTIFLQSSKTCVHTVICGTIVVLIIILERLYLIGARKALCRAL